MKKKLFGNSILPSCSLCEFFTNGGDELNGICTKKKTTVSLEASCKKFVYDPLKRIPKPLPALQKFDKSDFEL